MYTATFRHEQFINWSSDASMIYSMHRAGIPVAQLQMQLQQLQMQFQMLQAQYQAQAMAAAGNPQHAMMLQAQFMQQQQMIAAQMQQVQQVKLLQQSAFFRSTC
jgi:hypothetical protein